LVTYFTEELAFEYEVVKNADSLIVKEKICSRCFFNYSEIRIFVLEKNTYKTFGKTTLKFICSICNKITHLSEKDTNKLSFLLNFVAINFYSDIDRQYAFMKQFARFIRDV